MIQIIDTGYSSADANMKRDAELLESLHPDGKPLLHLYEWQSLSVTYGHFIKPEEYFNLEMMKHNNLSAAKRPTGGGIIFHMWDYAFSFLMPANHKYFSQNTLENYRFVHEIVIQALIKTFSDKAYNLLPQDPKAVGDEGNFCMAKPTIFDVMWEDKKIVGAAQRRKKQGYLHQGSISLQMPDPVFLKKVLREDKKNVVEAMLLNTYPLTQDKDISTTRNRLKENLKKEFICRFKE